MGERVRVSADRVYGIQSLLALLESPAILTTIRCSERCCRCRSDQQAAAAAETETEAEVEAGAATEQQKQQKLRQK